MRHTKPQVAANEEDGHSPRVASGRNPAIFTWSVERIPGQFFDGASRIAAEIFHQARED